MILVAADAVAAAVRPTVAVTIDPSHRLVEGVATDGRTIWISSVLDRQIVACTARCRTLATLPDGFHPLGLAWDWHRKLIWVAADCPKLPGIAQCRSGALFALDRLGKVRGRFAPKQDFHPGDVSVSLRAVFVSDSQNGMIYGLLPNKPLKPVNRPGDGRSAQGTALAPDGVSVIVADYSRGIGRLDLASTSTIWLKGQDGKTLRGIDGLVRCGETYFGIYNGSAPARLLTIKIRPDAVEYADLVPVLNLPDPTQIAYDGKRLLVVSNAGWEAAAKPGVKRSVGAPILAIPLRQGCEGK